MRLIRYGCPGGTCTKIKTDPSIINVPMEASRWEYEADAVEFTTHRNVSVKEKNGRGLQIFLKDQVLVSGTIEFDVELIGVRFPGINVRLSEEIVRGRGEFNKRSIQGTT